MERPPLLTLPGERGGREAAPGSPKADDFKAWIIGRSGGYRNLAVRGKKAAGEPTNRRSDRRSPHRIAGLRSNASRLTATRLLARQSRATTSPAGGPTAVSRAGGRAPDSAPPTRSADGRSGIP